MSSNNEPPTPLSQSARQPAALMPRADLCVVESQHLLQGRNEIQIRHGQDTYRLRHTRNDKLILTK
jgi:hemin uptake protein HemP